MVLRSLKRFFRQAVATTTSLSLALAPAIANAQQAAPSIVIDNRTNPSAPSPSLDRTANGVQQLNIATPNGAGLSHNMFTQYGVEQKGLILNNATKATQTQLGGYVYGNANLHGKAANVILNEVTGTQASQMLGYTEVAGQKANVVVANPNGITCNGCGFINTDRVSLATGHPEIDASGKLSALTVSDGLIAFEGKGGDFTAVPVLDILSRRVMLDAKVTAQTARLVAGRSRFDYETGTVHALKSDGSKTPEFAIDSTALGGMYAGQISMIVNEAGAGVRVNGTMAANAGDMTLTADGRLVLNGTMAASGSVGVQAAGVDNTGTLQSGAETHLASSADIQNKGSVSAGQGLTVSGTSLTNNGVLTAAGKDGASFVVAGDTRNSGNIGADQGPLSLQASSLTTEAGSKLASAGDMTVKIEKSVSNTGQISTATGALRLTAASLANRGQGFIGAGGDLAVSVGEYQGEAGSALKAETALTLVSTGTVQNSGLISTNADLNVTAASLVNNGTLYGAASTTVQADQGVTNIAGQIGSGSGLLSVTAADLNNGSGKIIAQSGAIGLSAGRLDNRAGVIQGQGDVVLSARTLDNRQAGSVQSLGGSLMLGDGTGPMQDLLNQGGVLGAAQTLSLNTDAYESDASSQLTSTGVLTLVMAGTLDNGGTLSGDKGFDLTVGGFRNEASGILAAKSGDGTLRVTGSDRVVNAGALETLTSGSLLSIESGGDFTNTGRVIGSGAVSVRSQGVVSNTGQMSALGGDLSLRAASFDNEATFAAAGNLSAGVAHDLTNTGAIYGVGSVVLGAGGVLKNAAVPGAQAGTTGSIDAKSGTILIAAQTLENSGGGAIVAAAGGLGLSAEDVTNSASVLQGQTGVLIKADRLTNTDQGEILAQAGALGVQGFSASDAQTILNTGILQAQTGLGLQAGALTNRSGTILSVAGPVALDLTAALENEGGIIQSASDMTVRAGSYTSDVTSVINAANTLDAAFTGGVDDVGHIVAGNGLSLSAASVTTHGASKEDDVAVIGSTSGNVTITTQALQNAGSLLAEGAGATLSVAVTGDMTSSGTVIARRGSADLMVGSLENSGLIEAVDSASVKAVQSLTNTGTLFAGTDLTAQSKGMFSNAGGQIGGATVSLNSAGVFENTGGKVVSQTGDLTLGAASVQNESGVLQGQGNVTLTADGLDNRKGMVQAVAGALSVASADGAPGAILNTNGILQAGQTVSLAFSQLENTNGSLLALGQGMTLAGTTSSDITNTGGQIASNGDLRLTGRQYDGQGLSSVLKTVGALSVTLSDALHNGGKFVSGGAMTVTAGSVANDNEAVLGTADGALALTLTGTDGLGNAGTIQSKGAGQTVSITAASLSNTSTGSVLSNGAQNLTLTGALENAGKLVSFNSPLSIQAGSLVNSNQIEAGGDLTLKSTGTLTNTGLLYGLTGAAISAATVENTSGQAGVQSGVLSVTADQIQNGQAGRLVASAGQVALTAQGIANDNGLIEAAGDVTLLTSSLNNAAGKVISDHGALMLERTADGAGAGEVNNTLGALQAGTDLTVYAATVENRSGAILTQGGNLTLTGGADGSALHSVVDNAGTLQAAQDLTLTTDSLTGASSLSAGRDLAFTTAQGQSAAMLFSAGRNASVQLGGTYEIQAGSGVIAGGNATVRASGITNAGALMAGGNLTVQTQGSIINTGLMEGTTGLALAVDGALTNTQGAILSDAGSISIGGLSGQYAGDVLNQSGEIMAGSAAGDVTIHAASLTNNIINNGITVDQTATEIYYSQTYDQGLTGSLPTPANLGDSGKYYYGQKVLQIFTPTGLLGTDGQAGSGYFLAALYGGGASSKVVVTGSGAKVTVNGAPALLDAGRTLNIDLLGNLTNTGSHIAAGGDMSLSGNTLDNEGYATSVVFQFSCYNGNSCRYYQPPAGVPAPNPEPQGLAWDIGKQGGWPWPSHLWGSSSYSVVASSIIAGNTLTAVFKDKIDNTTLVEHATAAQLAAAAQYTGSVPGSVTPSGQAAAVNGGSLTLPTTGQFADASAQTGTGTGAASAVSGNGLSGGAGTGVASASGAGGSSTVLPSFGGVLTPEGHESGATAAQHLSLPGFTGTTDPSTAQLIASVPAGKALYVPTSNSDAHYLIETNPAYTSLTAFHGSEYLLDRLGDQPQDYTFLGDSAFEQQYVQQQILTATGQTFLGGTYNTASSQMQALLDNAANESSQLGLTLGQGLSSAQQAALTSDIVWYQNEEVDGKTVLVPKLYLAPGHEALTDTTISGRNVSLTAGSISNSGTISAQDSLSLKTTTGDITNTGRLSGGTVSLTAQDGSIINSDTLNTYLVQGGNQQQIASFGTITAKSAVSLSAGNTITFNGGAVTTGGDLSLLAGEGITLGSTTVRQAASVSGKGLTESGNAVQNYGTTLNVGGDALLEAQGGDLKSAGASIVSNGSTSLYAAKTLDLGSVTNSQSHAVSGKKSGFLTHSRFSDSQSSSTEQGTTIAAGGSLNVVSGGDMSVKGAIGAAGDVTLLSGGTFTESATKNTEEESHSHHTAGLHVHQNWLTGANSMTYKSSTDTSSASATTWTPSVIASTEGNLIIGSTGAMVIDASIVAAAANLGLSGSSVSFTTQQNTTTQAGTHKDWSIGTNAGLSSDSIIGAAVNSLGDVVQNSGSGTQKVLSTLQTGVSEGTSIAAGAQSGNLVGVSVSIGASKDQSSSTETISKVLGSTAAAGGSLKVEARGDNESDAANGSLKATAAALSAQNIIMSASKDISLDAGWNTTHSQSTSSSKSFSVGANANVGTSGAGVSISASGSMSHTHTEAESATAVDTTVTATEGITIVAPGTTTLNGAEVSGKNIVLNTGNLLITSPVNTASYEKEAYGGSVGVTIPVWGAAMGGASVSLNYEKITDRYASTGERLSGVYAGSGGLDVVVQGDTVLKAGVLDSEAPSSLNRFSTGSLSASSIDDTSEWEGLATGVAASFGASTSTTQGSFNGKASQGGSGGTFELGIGVVSHHEHGTSNSAISGNIEVNAGSLSGSYTTDVSSANGHLANKFDAHAVEKTLQAEVGGEMAAEGTAEAVYQLVASSQKGADTDQDGSEKQNTDVDATSAAHGAGASDDGTVSGGSPSPDGSSSGGASPRGTGATPSSIITQKVALGGSGRKTGFIEWYTSNPDGVTVNARRVTVVDQTVKTPGNSGVTAINLAANGTMQRLDYLKDNGQNKDVLDFITPPPLMDAIALYNLITHIGAGRYKDAAEDAAPFALGLAGAEAGPYLGKAAKAVLTKENIQEAIDKAAGLLGKSHEWKPYESGSVGAAQPSLPDGYSWVKNAEGDLGIKTPEGQVVSDSQGKTEILLDHRNSYDSQGEIVAEQNVAEDGAERGVLIDANFAQNRIKSDRSFSPDGQKIYSDLAGKPIKTVDDLAAALKAGIVKPSQIPVDYVDMNGNRLILNTRTSTALEQAGIPRSEWFGRNQTGVEVYPGKTFNDLASDQLKNNKLPPTGAETLRSVRP